MHGLVNLPWWGYIIVTLVLTQITIFAVTIFLHRSQSHRALELHPIVSHFFRFWLWLTTGMETKHWVAIHRKHHSKVETEEDPHSPQVKGIWKVMWEGTELYRKESKNQETLDRYGEGTPDDWMEKHVYTKHSALGIMIMLGIDIALFGFLGLSIWAVQMAWIPFFAAGVINGIGHYVGYRNFECADASRNIIPIGFFIGGEELHNNHHTYGTSAKFSVKPWEFDIGWVVIRILQTLKLANPKRIPPVLGESENKKAIDLETVKAVLSNRFQVMANYSKTVILPVLNEEKKRAGRAGNALYGRIKKLLIRETSLVKEEEQKHLQALLQKYRSLEVVYQFKLKLQNIWARSTTSQRELVEALQEWCRQAEASGIEVLREFVSHVKSYVVLNRQKV